MTGMKILRNPGGKAAPRRLGLVWRTLAAAALTAVVMSPAVRAQEAPAPGKADCVAAGTWLEPATGAVLASDRLLSSLAARPVVLLGEAHDDAEHHRWQLQMLAALHGLHPDMVIGFESFPRRVQPVLDKWVNGEFDAEAFLKAVDWPTVWGYDAALYLPLFHFARQNRVPMIALNVERTLISRVREVGWAAIPADEREGLSDPAPASDAYRKSLAEIYIFEQSHMTGRGEEGDPQAAAAGAETPPAEPDIASVLGTEDFARFVEAQLTWDRAMAEALATARQRRPGALVVGILGGGHIEHRWGVPHQLADLGIADAAVLLPVEREAACDELSTDLADAVFVVEPPVGSVAAAPRPRLGIMITTTDDGVRVAKVIEDSVAEATGIAVDDIVVSAAGFPVAKVGELIEIVQRQAPGTWLPLVVRRSGKEIDLVAKFPKSFEAPE